MRKEYDFSKAKRGPAVRVPKGKTRITIRLDNDVISWFKQQVHKGGGGSYQSLMNTALRDHIKRSDEPLEATLRRVLREELRSASG
jgi:uncharacterized protein (DUF4415 family)